MAIDPGYLDEEHDTWEWNGNEWVAMGQGNIMANARAWSSEVVTGYCNTGRWEIPVSVHASVAQWVEFSLSGSRYIWRVRKPGEYTANSLTATLQSNGDVKIDFEGFANLQSVSGDSVEKEIPIWYAATNVMDPNAIYNWIPATELNVIDDLVKDSAKLHRGYAWKLWNKIKVVECNSACEYQNDATITLVLDNQKDWIDPSTGYFAELQ